MEDLPLDRSPLERGAFLGGKLVEPATSQNSTVTTLRCSLAGGAAASAAPQESQKRASSRFSAPQLGHFTARP